MKIKVGDLVWLMRPLQGAPAIWHRVSVMKIGRIWVDLMRLSPDGYIRGMWRVRLDTQDDGTDSAYRCSWYTDQQRIDMETEASADAFIRHAGITVQYGSPWRLRRVELAKLIGWVEPPLPEWAATDREDTDQ